MLRGSLLHMSENRALAHWLTHHPLGRQLASRFVAGETIDSAIEAVQRLNADGVWATLDHLGEAVTSPEEACAAAAEYLAILDRLNQTGVLCGVSLKLTQLGLDISPALATKNLIRMVEKASAVDQFVRLDMEDSHHTDLTLSVFRDVWGQGHHNCGIVLQAYLYRTAEDVEAAIRLGCRVRLCKGAYAEPENVAFPHKADTDANYVKLARRLLEAGTYPAFATHDERIVRQIVSWNPDPASFEFQMLYGVRPELQRTLVRQGYRVRAYVPFGSDWYAYFMRRLAERPANLAFFLSTLVKEPLR
ncbi:MAG: proline dehydrogenase family protein [Chloroflexota bacterium]|nr:proline dehydrogenase family protein [Chloroflexota bacterium]